MENLKKIALIVWLLFVGSFTNAIVCTMDVKQCPDGSFVGRTGPKCEFAPCPDEKSKDIEDTQIIDEINKNSSSFNFDIKFKQFNSCEDLETVLKKFAKEYYYNYEERYYTLPNASVDTSAMSVGMKTLATPGEDADYSQTNVQVKGVDEADIIKNDGKNIYYYNQKQNAVYIIKSSGEILKKILLPKETSNVNIYIQGNKLVILGQKYFESKYNFRYIPKLIDRSTKTLVVIYDISDMPKIKLDKLYMVDGHYFDSRLLENKLFVVSRLDINMYPMPFVKVYNANSNKEDTQVNFKSNDILPKQTSIYYTNDKEKQNFKIHGKKVPYNLNSENVDCNNVYYILPDENTIKNIDISPSFSIVSVIDINKQQKPQTKILFGDLANIYMSKKSIYITNNFYTTYNSYCPLGAMCIMPYFRAGENSLIHKFDLDIFGDDVLKYKNSNLIQGLPLNQYSMNEDAEGYFYMITKSYTDGISTNLFVLDNDLKPYSSLTNIEKGEEFKSSRFIGDKLYLVTFQQIDPLFIIDLKDKKNPQIIGQLKIPGYSTYLHPYDDIKNQVQHLIGIGYDTATGHWGGVVNAGIKIDLYEIDYNSVSSGNISVKQLFTKTFGDKGSYSPSLANPRMFVWDSQRKILFLPMLLQKNKKLIDCHAYYDEDGKEYRKECYPIEKFETIFAGTKGIEIKDGIKEIYSKNYKDILLKEKDYSYDGQIQQWTFENLGFRVGYIGDMMFNINNLFVDFDDINSNTSKMINFE